eukprot:98931-Chlamydomonas_euryale.AAC.3
MMSGPMRLLGYISTARLMRVWMSFARQSCVHALMSIWGGGHAVWGCGGCEGARCESTARQSIAQWLGMLWQNPTLLCVRVCGGGVAAGMPWPSGSPALSPSGGVTLAL